MRAQDVMSRNVATVGPETPLSTALAVMVSKQVSGLPVVNAQGHLVGILTEGDLLHRSETGTGHQARSKWVEFLVGPGHSARQYVTEHSRRVGDLMTDEVVSVGEDATLDEVVALMEKRHIRRVPVVSDGRPVGIVSRRDLLRALVGKLAALPETSTSDQAIETAIRAELEPQSWIVASNVNIIVKDGVVTLDGIIFDDRCRDSLRVAAQNVAGVKKVEDELVWVDPQTGAVFPVT